MLWRESGIGIGVRKEIILKRGVVRTLKMGEYHKQGYRGMYTYCDKYLMGLNPDLVIY